MGLFVCLFGFCFFGGLGGLGSLKDVMLTSDMLFYLLKEVPRSFCLSCGSISIEAKAKKYILSRKAELLIKFNSLLGYQRADLFC